MAQPPLHFYIVGRVRDGKWWAKRRTSSGIETSFRLRGFLLLCPNSKVGLCFLPSSTNSQLLLLCAKAMTIDSDKEGSSWGLHHRMDVGNYYWYCHLWWLNGEITANKICVLRNREKDGQQPVYLKANQRHYHVIIDSDTQSGIKSLLPSATRMDFRLQNPFNEWTERSFICK